MVLKCKLFVLFIYLEWNIFVFVEKYFFKLLHNWSRKHWQILIFFVSVFINNASTMKNFQPFSTQQVVWNLLSILYKEPTMPLHCIRGSNILANVHHILTGDKLWNVNAPLGMSKAKSMALTFQRNIHVYFLHSLPYTNLCHSITYIAWGGGAVPANIVAIYRHSSEVKCQ